MSASTTGSAHPRRREYETPVPGKDVVARVPRRPSVKRAPRRPALTDAPRLERLSVSPLTSRTRLKKRQPKSAHRPAQLYADRVLSRPGLGRASSRVELFELQRVEARDVVVGPLRRLEREQVPDAARDVHLRVGIRAANERGVACGDHAILAAPQHKRRDVAERSDAVVQRERELLAPGHGEEQEPPPDRWLVRPHDGAHRAHLRRALTVPPQHPIDEPVVVTAPAADQEVAKVPPADLL